MIDNAEPCPFCGCTDIRITYLDFDGHTTDTLSQMDSIVAVCTQCMCRVILEDDGTISDDTVAKRQIAEKWNRRQRKSIEEKCRGAKDIEISGEKYKSSLTISDTGRWDVSCSDYYYDDGREFTIPAKESPLLQGWDEFGII